MSKRWQGIREKLDTKNAYNVTTCFIVNPILEIRRVPFSNIMATDKGSGANKDLITFKPDGKFGSIFLVT